jgi:hypothetical protein
MNVRIGLALAWFGLAMAPAVAGDPCERYAVTTRFLGVLEKRTHPGPPNFESVEKGDRADTDLFLRLPAPLCVDASPPLDPRGVSGVHSLQLIVSGETGAEAEKQVGAKVRVRGQLRGARSRLHRTPVVLAVQSLQPAQASFLDLEGLLAQARAASTQPGSCSEAFATFLARFSSDLEVQLASIEFPLAHRYIDPSAEPEPQQRVETLSATAYREAELPYFPTLKVHAKYGLETSVTGPSPDQRIVQFEKPASDAFSVRYSFRCSRGRWRLTLIDDSSL